MIFHMPKHEILNFRNGQHGHMKRALTIVREEDQRSSPRPKELPLFPRIFGPLHALRSFLFPRLFEFPCVPLSPTSSSRHMMDRPTRSISRRAPHAIDERLRYIRPPFRDKPFGGISLVLKFLLNHLLLPIYRCIRTFCNTGPHEGHANVRVFAFDLLNFLSLQVFEGSFGKSLVDINKLIFAPCESSCGSLAFQNSRLSSTNNLQTLQHSQDF
jgi:hypothetical protein